MIEVGLSYARQPFVVARNPNEGTILLGGLGALGVGQMWFPEDASHEAYSGYSGAAIVWDPDAKESHGAE